MEPGRAVAAIPGVTTDRAVVLRSLDDPGAFGELFDRHARTLHRFIARRTNDAVADDVVGETFLRAFERRARFSTDREDALPWLFGIAVNVLRHHRRAELRFVDGELDRPDDHDAVAAVGRRVDAERHLRLVVEAVRRMPAGTRDVVLLHLWAELGYEEVAEALGIPVGTVRSRLSRARTRLRDLPTPLPAPTPDRHRTGGTDGRDAAAPQLP